MVKVGCKQTEVGVIPDDWNVAPISEAFEIKNTLRLPISKQVREIMVGPYPYYGPTSIQGYINEYRIEGEHALIGEDGDHFLKWRDMPMTLLVNGKFNVNNHAHVIKGVHNLTTWFYWYFNQRDITSHLTRQGAGRYKLTKKALEAIPCALPPLEEQQAITGVLSDVDALIAGLDKLIAKKRDVKTAVMQQLLTGKKRLPGFDTGEGYKQTEIGEIPKNWDIVPLEILASFVGSGKSNSGKSEGDYPVHGSTGVIGYCTKPEYEGDSILVARVGANAGKLHFASGSYGVTDNTIIVKLSDKSNLQFIFYQLLRKNINSLVFGSGQPLITGTQLKSLPIIFPSIQEQQAITEVLSDIETEITALEARRAKTRAIKQGMMQELLTGRTRLL